MTTSSRARRGALPLLALAVVLLGLTACSSTASSSPTASGSSSTASAATSFEGVRVSGDIKTEPTFLIGDATQSVTSLQVSDVIVGTGATATPTDKVTVRYVARSAKTKRPFDSSWARGKDFSYDTTKIGFKAFAQGVSGMKVGGRRIVIVPGPLAYGPTPKPGLGLGPNETLVFVIDLVSIDK